MSIKTLIGKITKRVPLLHNVSRYIYYFFQFGLTKKIDLMCALKNFSDSKKNIYFVQVGANNGIDRFTDFRMKYDWSGILIEPQKHVFDELKTNNKWDKNVYFENSAISEYDDIKTLYKLSVSESWWATGIASFDKSNILKHLQEGYLDAYSKKDGIKIEGDPEKYIIEEKVNCISFNTLKNKYNIKEIDLLIIDTEGHDYKVLKSFNINKIRPSIIIYEFVHLPKNEFKESIKLLKLNNYDLYYDYVDIVGILNT